MMKRSEAATAAQQTVEIVERGTYEVNGQTIDIREWTAAAVADTVNHRGDEAVPALPPDEACETAFEVFNETTLDAAKRIAQANPDVVPAALNFASAKNPGGGFLGGARAQEESLARSSALYHCLRDQPMYEFHRERRDAMYTSWVIWSPAVPVIREDSGELLADPYRCSFITSAAVNAGVVLDRHSASHEQIEEAMRDRVDRVLAVAAHHGASHLVLGAWGCGVFRNDPQMIARLFADALLHGRFTGRFRHITFAVLDTRNGTPVYAPFADAFGPSE